jgi:hypothetical protein
MGEFSEQICGSSDERRQGGSPPHQPTTPADLTGQAVTNTAVNKLIPFLRTKQE